MHTSTQFIMDCCILSKMHGKFKPVSVDWVRERERAIPIPDMEDRVLDHVDWDGGASMR
jgi:hypothetical protein